MKLPDFALNRADRILQESPTELPGIVERASNKLRRLLRDDLEPLRLLLEFLRYTVTGHWKPSTGDLALVLGTVIYFLLPFDLVPDIVPIAGFMDDASVISWCLVAVKDELERFSAWHSKITEEMNVVQAVQSAVGSFLAQANAYVGELRNQPPSAGSMYDLERQTLPNQQPLDTGLSLVWFLIEALGEHGALFCKALQPPVEVMAPATCVRVMLEASARIQWILDADIDCRERVGRVYAIRYQEQEQDLKFLSARGGRDALADRKEVAKKMCQITEEAARAGYRTVTAKRCEKQIGIHVPVPKITELIRDTIDQEIPYRLLSGLAHTRVLSLRRWCYETVYTDGPGGSAVKTLPLRNLALLGAIGACSIRDSVTAIGRFLGGDLDLLQRISNRGAEDMNLVMERVVGPLPESETPQPDVSGPSGTPSGPTPPCG